MVHTFQPKSVFAMTAIARCWFFFAALLVNVAADEAPPVAVRAVAAGRGIVVALAEKFSLPIHAVGTGEQIADLRPFDATEFARALVGE